MEEIIRTLISKNNKIVDGPILKISDVKDPTKYDDQSNGFSVGSRWINTSTNIEYTCTRNINGNACWVSGGGTAGNQGPQGYQGNNGLNGYQGAQGNQGNNGSNGTQGAQGAIGIGTQGYQGNNGINGTQGAQGAIGVGTQGVQGNQGNNGSNGTQGPQGNQGVIGLAGSTVFSGLTDVTFTSLINNQIPKYNSTSGKWENWTPNYVNGTLNYIPKFTASGTIGDSSISDNGSVVTISTSLKSIGNININDITTVGVISNYTMLKHKTFAGMISQSDDGVVYVTGAPNTAVSMGITGWNGAFSINQSANGLTAVNATNSTNKLVIDIDGNLYGTVIYENGTSLAAKYQSLDSDLTAIASLTGVSGFLKTNGSGTWSVDTNTYSIDSNVVHITGTETITGLKTFSSILTGTSASFTNSSNGTFAIGPASRNGRVFTVRSDITQFQLENHTVDSVLRISVDATQANFYYGTAAASVAMFSLTASDISSLVPISIKGAVALRLYDVDNSAYIALKAPSLTTTNYTYTLPVNYGFSGQALVTNGAGSLIWAAPNEQIYTSTGSSAGTSGYWVKLTTLDVTAQFGTSSCTIDFWSNSNIQGFPVLRGSIRTAIKQQNVMTSPLDYTSAHVYNLININPNRLKFIKTVDNSSNKTTEVWIQVDTSYLDIKWRIVEKTSTGVTSSDNSLVNTPTTSLLDLSINTTQTIYNSSSVLSETNSDIYIRTQGTGSASLKLATMNGSYLTQTATPASTNVGSIYFGGYNGSGIVYPSYIKAITEGSAYSGSNHGTYLTFIVTDLNSTTTINPFTIKAGYISSSVDVLINDGKYLKLYENSTNGNNFVGFRAPTLLSGDYTYTLPVSYGTPGYVLQTNGAGTLTWVEMTAGTGGAVASVDGRTGAVVLSDLYQAQSQLLTDITTSSLSGNGFLKRTGANTWAIDSNSYLTSNQTITISGQASGTGSNSISLTLDNNSIINKVLTGLSTTSTSVIVDSDSIVSGMGKLQAQISLVSSENGSYSQLIGDSTNNQIDITHGLNTNDIVFSVLEIATGDFVLVNVKVIDVNTIRLNFTDPPPSLGYRIIVKK